MLAVHNRGARRRTGHSHGVKLTTHVGIRVCVNNGVCCVTVYTRTYITNRNVRRTDKKGQSFRAASCASPIVRTTYNIITIYAGRLERVSTILVCVCVCIQYCVFYTFFPRTRKPKKKKKKIHTIISSVRPLETEAFLYTKTAVRNMKYANGKYERSRKK